MMYRDSDSIEVKATPEQTWQVLTNLSRLPEWYVPAQWVQILTAGPVQEGWQFILAVRTLSGIVLKALGTVKEFDSETRVIIWRGQAMGIAGDSQWRVVPTEDGYSRVDHTFQGKGWLMFLSQKLGRNRATVQRRLMNLKRLVEGETRPQVAPEK